MSKAFYIYLSIIGLVLAVLSLVAPLSLFFTLPIGFVIFCHLCKVRPTRFSIYFTLLLIGAGLSISFVPSAVYLWWGMLALWLLASLVDIIGLLVLQKFSIQRALPGRFAQGEKGEVTLDIKNETTRGNHLRVFDGVPQGANTDHLPWEGFVPGDSTATVTYEVSLTKRGWANFKNVFIEVDGLLRLWRRIIVVDAAENVRVYPNYEPVLQLALMSMESNPEQMGIILKNRAGMSKEFHQLRDYHEGDMLSQIDWKASSKQQSLISRSYHEQRDQNVILAIDCGRRMRAFDGDVSQFDHSLNALLLLAYVALKQGDNVGIMAYGGREHWLPPVKGVQSMTVILNHLFNYQTSSSPSDYGEAVERVLIQQKRRSMVVFVSNFRGEDAGELVEPLRRLRQKHVVTIGNIREQEVDDAMKEPVENFEEAIRLASIEGYLESRASVMQQLKTFNIPSVDVTASALPIALANQYLAHREMV